MIGPGLQRVCRSVGRETILIPWLVVDSPSSSRCSASRSSSRSSASRCCISCSAASRRCRRNATLVLRVGGELTEVAPADVVGYLRGVEDADRAVDRRQPAQGEGRSARPARCCSSRPASSRRSGRKVQEIRDAVLDFKKSGKPVYAYLEYGGDREYYLATAADKVFLMPSTPLDLTGVATYELFLRGTLDKIGAIPDLHHIGDYKTAVNTFTEKGYTRGAQGDGRVAEPRSLRADRARHRRRPEEERGRRPHADRRWAVPAGGRAARRPGRRRGVRGSGGRQAARRRAARASSTATTTRASARPRSA